VTPVRDEDSQEVDGDVETSHVFYKYASKQVIILK